MELDKKEEVKPKKVVKSSVKPIKTYKEVILKDVKIGMKVNGKARKYLKKGDTLELTKEQVENYKKNNLI